MHKRVSCEFIVTGSCNMNCSYCVAKDLTIQTLDIETGRKAVDLFLYLADGCESIEFTFSGGEPLLAVRTLTDLICYIDSHTHHYGIHADYVIKTNGSILNDDILNLLITYKVKAVVSIDGDAATHDRYRYFTNRRPSHELITQNLLAMINSGVETVASVTVHPVSSGLLLDNIKYLHETGISKIDVGPVYGTVTWDLNSIKVLMNSFVEIADYMRSVNTHCGILSVGPINKDSEHAGGYLADSWGCHAGIRNLAFLPNGEITGCSALAMLSTKHPELIVGNVSDGINQDAIDKLTNIAGADNELRTACHSCLSAVNCTGGCMAINYSTTGKALISPLFYCHILSSLEGLCRKAWSHI